MINNEVEWFSQQVLKSVSTPLLSMDLREIELRSIILLDEDNQEVKDLDKSSVFFTEVDARWSAEAMETISKYLSPSESRSFNQARFKIRIGVPSTKQTAELVKLSRMVKELGKEISITKEESLRLNRKCTLDFYMENEMARSRFHLEEKEFRLNEEDLEEACSHYGQGISKHVEQMFKSLASRLTIREVVSQAAKDAKKFAEGLTGNTREMEKYMSDVASSK